VTEPLWTILIASVYARHAQLVELLQTLAQQVAPYHGEVTVLVERDDCELGIGDKRSRLVRMAESDYVCFVDDDDTVAPSYAARIMDALHCRPDYVGFKVDVTLDGFPSKQASHSLRHTKWSEDDAGYYRGISHLNPIRRRAAIAGLPFLNGFGEDHDWAAKVAQSGLVTTEVFVNEPLYEYRHSRAGSLFTGGLRRVGSAPALPELPHVEHLNG
jgi:glycosyltransferase involved in cell wall biosynthesis